MALFLPYVSAYRADMTGVNELIEEETAALTSRRLSC